MNEPEFIKSDVYYYDALNNRIFGREYKSKEYYHELSHYYDNKNKTYAKISYIMELYLETLSVFSVVFLTLAYINNLIFVHKLMIGRALSVILVFFLIYALWRTQEELRAMYNAKRWYKNRGVR